MTALHVAVLNQNVEMVKLLVSQNNIDVNAILILIFIYLTSFKFLIFFIQFKKKFFFK